MTETESILHDMLIEDCGVAMMDSGGDGGRNWQKNRSVKDFRLLSPINYEHETWTGKTGIEGYWRTITRLLFHHLNDHLTYDREETRRLEKWLKKNDSFTNSTSDVEEYIEQAYCANNLLYHPGGSQDESYSSGNTYNSENLLSQGFSYVTYGEYIFISIHGGADIRGGYGSYKVFKQDEHDLLWVNAASCRMKCECGSVYSDDGGGYRWYDDQSYVLRFTDETDEGFPTCWKQAEGKKLRCSKCGDIVEVD